MQRLRSLFLFALMIVLPLQIHAKSIPVEKTALTADITFLIADLKYNAQDGVKICEIQNGSFSLFSGWDFLNGTEAAVPQLFTDFIDQYHNQVWYSLTSIADPKFREHFLSLPWIDIVNYQTLLKTKSFKKNAKIMPANIFSISNYMGIAWVHPNAIKSVSAFRRDYPGVLLMDAAMIPYSGDKYLMTKLFANDEHLIRLKPRWNSYPKQYTPTLAAQICSELETNIVVIKPRRSALGNGIIIASADELDGILHYIFTNPNNQLASDPDSSYNYWARDRCDTFLVEQFIPSDPVNVPQLDNQLYDCTMRVVFFLYYDNQEMNIHFLEGHWKVPKLAVNSGGTLTEIHKSYGKTPHFAFVDEEVLNEVKRQLAEGLPYLYKQMLGI